LVYSVAQRRLHQALVRQNESLPNQINQPTQRPTLRWVFQLLEGIHRVRVIVQDQVHDLIEQYSGQNLSCLFGDDPIATKGFVIRAEFFQTLPIG